MSNVVAINYNHLKQHYGRKKAKPGFELESDGDISHDVAVKRTKSNASGPAAIVTLSAKARELLNA